MIKLEDSKRNIRELYPEYMNNNSISMHFRLGDYKQKQEYHPILHHKYYHDSLSHIFHMGGQINQKTVFYFCEKEDNDEVSVTIRELTNDFPYVLFVKVDDTIEDWKQMLIMSNCHHNIIANSSFSWWGAYFNSNPHKIVCYPSLWFGPAATNNNTSTMFPTEWKCI